MKIRIGKTFLEEINIRGLNDHDERGAILLAVITRATRTKTGMSVDVSHHELDHFIQECEWFVYNNSPEDSSDCRRNFNNLNNQLRSFQKVKASAL